MQLPPGIKTLPEIRSIPLVEDCIPAYATLLEFILRRITPSVESELTLNGLIQFHEAKFRIPNRVYFANSVRNDLVHATGRFGPTEWDKAADILDGAIEDIVPDFLRDEVLGRSSSSASGASGFSWYPGASHPVVQIVEAAFDHLSKDEASAQPVRLAQKPASPGVHPIVKVLGVLAGLVLVGAMFSAVERYLEEEDVQLSAKGCVAIGCLAPIVIALSIVLFVSAVIWLIK